MQGEFEKKIDDFMISSVHNISEPDILEFGVRKGISTKKFINICEKNNGHLYSVDIDDCSEISKSKNWTFWISISTWCTGLYSLISKL